MANYYDPQGEALSAAAGLNHPLATPELQVLLAIAKHRKRERGDKQGYSLLSNVSQTTGFSSRSLASMLDALEADNLVILAPGKNWARLTDSGRAVVYKTMAPWEQVVELSAHIERLELILNAFNIDISQAMRMLDHGDGTWLCRAGNYGSALVQSYGKLTPDMHTEESGPLMKRWLWQLPGYANPETGVAETHQDGVNSNYLQPLLYKDEEN